MFILLSYISIITKLSSLNYSNYYVNITRFNVFVTHFIVVVGREHTCFSTGL
jgi:hypothetical protein